MFHERDSDNDADTSVLERQMFGPGLDSRDVWLQESKQIVAIRVYPDKMVDSAQANSDSTGSATEVNYKSPLRNDDPAKSQIKDA